MPLSMALGVRGTVAGHGLGALEGGGGGTCPSSNASLVWATALRCLPVPFGSPMSSGPIRVRPALEGSENGKSKTPGFEPPRMVRQVMGRWKRKIRRWKRHLNFPTRPKLSVVVQDNHRLEHYYFPDYPVNYRCSPLRRHGPGHAHVWSPHVQGAYPVATPPPPLPV